MFFLLTCVVSVGVKSVSAQGARSANISPVASPSPTPSPIPSASPDSTATASATPVVQISQPSAADITQTTGPTRSKLAIYLDENPLTSNSPVYFIQRAIRDAVNKGVPANILVLLLLFPVTASLIAIFRHIIGLRGFGVYTPAVLAVAFISTGITRGLFLFGIIFLTSMIGRAVINRMKLQYLPRAALLLWLVSIVFFGLILISPYISVLDFVSIGIFPLIVLILLSENFLEAQLSGSFSAAVQLTGETLVLAVISTLFMRTLFVQQFVILHPEITILVVLGVNVLVGKYTGLRVTELLRFKPILDPEE